MAILKTASSSTVAQRRFLQRYVAFEEVASLGSCVGLWPFTSDYVSSEGGVLTARNANPLGPNLVQASAANQPALGESLALGTEVLSFDPDRQRYVDAESPVDYTQPHTMFGICRLHPTGAQFQTPIGYLSTSTNRSCLTRINDGPIDRQYNDGGARVGEPTRSSGWAVLFGFYDGNLNLGGTIDDGPIVTDTATTEPTGTLFRVGGGSAFGIHGEIALAGFFNADLSVESNAATLALVQDMIRSYLGTAVTI